MLFLGTAKYPDENASGLLPREARRLVNAYTALEDTNYFNVNAPALLGEGGRDARSAVRAVLRRGRAKFAVDSLDREMLAVDSDTAWRCSTTARAGTSCSRGSRGRPPARALLDRQREALAAKRCMTRRP